MHLIFSRARRSQICLSDGHLGGLLDGLTLVTEEELRVALKLCKGRIKPHSHNGKQDLA